jgi:hypothetical protein
MEAYSFATRPKATIRSNPGGTRNDDHGQSGRREGRDRKIQNLKRKTADGRDGR